MKRPHIFVAMTALAVAMTVIIPSSASAQGDTIRTMVVEGSISGVGPRDLPLPFDFMFDNGPLTVLGQENGKFSKEIDPALGDFQSLMVHGQLVPLDKPTVVKLPSGAQRIVTIRVHVQIWRSGGHWYIKISFEVTATES